MCAANRLVAYDIDGSDSGKNSRIYGGNPPTVIYRLPVIKGQTVKTTSTRKYKCPICGQSVRATKHVNIMCLDCNAPMVEEE